MTENNTGTPAPGSPEAIAAEAAATKATADAAAGRAAEGGDGTPANLMDEAAKEAKAATDAENKRLLDAKDEDLSEPDKLKKAELIKANAEAEKTKGVPEKYEFTTPEGMVLDQEMVDKFTPIAKKLNLNQADAQTLVDLYSEGKKASDAAQAESFKTFVEGLKTETIKELGANYKERLSFAAKARDRFTSPELVEKLNASGLANDKDVVKLFITMGEAIAEDKVPPGPAGTGGKRTPEEILFPSTVKK